MKVTLLTQWFHVTSIANVADLRGKINWKTTQYLCEKDCITSLVEKSRKFLPRADSHTMLTYVWYDDC